MARRSYSEADDDRFRREWARGTLVKVLANELGRTESSVRSHRQALGLKPRKHRGDKTRSIRLVLNHGLRKAAGNRSFAMQMTLSAYVRRLICRDVGMPVD